jgi:hypothetical protein
MDTITKTAGELRAAVRALGTRGQGRRYPEALKRDVLAHLAERRKVGRGIATTSAEIGIPRKTLKLWAATPRAPGAPSFVPMTIVERDDRGRAIVVHAPGGIRIEGLDVVALADLLRRLG